MSEEGELIAEFAMAKERYYPDDISQNSIQIILYMEGKTGRNRQIRRINNGHICLKLKISEFMLSQIIFSYVMNDKYFHMTPVNQSLKYLSPRFTFS